MFFILAGTGLVAYWGYRDYLQRLNEQDRAAESFPTRLDAKTPGQINATTARPMTTSGRGYSGTALMTDPGKYHPLSDVSENQIENQVKVLNIANQFLYG